MDCFSRWEDGFFFYRVYGVLYGVFLILLWLYYKMFFTLLYNISASIGGLFSSLLNGDQGLSSTGNRFEIKARGIGLG